MYWRVPVGTGVLQTISIAFVNTGVPGSAPGHRADLVAPPLRRRNPDIFSTEFRNRVALSHRVRFQVEHASGALAYSTSRDLSRAGSLAGRSSATHSPVFQRGTGVGQPALGTKRERSMSFILCT